MCGPAIAVGIGQAHFSHSSLLIMIFPLYLIFNNSQFCAVLVAPFGFSDKFLKNYWPRIHHKINEMALQCVYVFLLFIIIIIITAIVIIIITIITIIIRSSHILAYTIKYLYASLFLRIYLCFLFESILLYNFFFSKCFLYVSNISFVFYLIIHLYSSL